MRKIIHTLILFWRKYIDPIQKYGLFLIGISCIGFELFIKIELGGVGHTGLLPVFSIITFIIGVILMIFGKSLFDINNNN